MGGLLGGLASLMISVGLMVFVGTTALALLVGIGSRSRSVLSGVLCGFGATWLVLIGSSYRRCIAMGPDCGGGEGMVPFLVIAGVVFLAGVAVGFLGIARDRHRTKRYKALDL